jgi:putative phosphoesterase
MKIALLGDIHANLPALETVLADAAAAGAEALWNMGDFVGYGPFPEQVVQRCRQEGMLAIVGNYDRKVLRYPAHPAKTHNSLKQTAFAWAAAQLSPTSHAYLAALPEQRRVETAGWEALLCHGSPASIKEHLTLLTPDERLAELAQLAATPLVVCGHSHQPFARQVAGVWFINTGSVGRPDDGDPRACYALLELAPGRLAVEHRRLAYDVERAVAALRQLGLPAEFGAMLRQGRTLEQLEG